MSCQTCDNYSGFYPLCRECNIKKEKGKIIQCDDCKQYHYKNQKCSCKTWHPLSDMFDNKNNNKGILNPLIIDEDENGCLLCDNTAQNSYLLCKSCIKEFNAKSKDIFLKISNAQDIEIMDTNYKGNYKSKDGHIVKSKAEREIDNYLYDHDIKHAYEKAFPISNNENEDIHPDFYLQDKDIWIEYWGYDNEDYQRKKDYKTKIYEKAKITIIYLDKNDDKDIETALDRKIKNCKAHRINY